MPRPRSDSAKRVRLSVRLTEKQADMLDQLRAVYAQSRSAYVEQLITRDLDEHQAVRALKGALCPG